ncbi:monocarboxylate transporter 9 [Bombyx mori]|uniref:Major facilitator superfamily (MFS) profile domain-containing protein n=1 Tax=Bombyx mori TaxID=7091 RepID=A0A8R1WHW7_BOMMO|nr:monocarboxylate transporter 9 [Bombyx mori]
MSNAPAYKVPPDGGYGWVITFAYALNNVVVLPLISSFGLVFQEAFDETGLTPTQGTLVIILNHSIGMLLSFFGGPLLRRFGYRKVAAVGAILISAGLILTSLASSFWVFILSYSILNSMGVASVMAAFTLAINSFFKEKRSRAIGVGMSVTGLGAIYMPLLMSTLIYAYGWRYAVLILSAICLHSLLAACLLRPAKWYLKDPPLSEELVPLNKETDVELVNGSITSSLKGIASLHMNDTKENGGIPMKSFSMGSLNSNSSLQSRNAVSHPDVRPKQNETPLAQARYKWWESQEVNLGSSINIFNEIIENKKHKEVDVLTTEEKEKKGFLQNFVDFFDLTLLKDPIFVSILIGLSVAACVETNFSLLLPIILKDMLKFETSEIAQIMSIIGFSDTLFRLVAPFIGEWWNKSPRVMYMVSLTLVIIIRTIMLFTHSYLGMVFVAVAMGFTKGIRTVYMNLIIPCYVPLERLPFASGIQMFFNGIIIASIGSLLGRIRESSGTYIMPIIVLNIVTLLTIILWNCEFLYLRIKNKNQKDNQLEA